MVCLVLSITKLQRIGRNAFHMRPVRTSDVGVLGKSYQCPQYFHCVLFIQELQGQTAETLQNGLLANPPQCQKEFARKKKLVYLRNK